MKKRYYFVIGGLLATLLAIFAIALNVSLKEKKKDSSSSNNASLVNKQNSTIASQHMSDKTIKKNTKDNVEKDLDNVEVLVNKEYPIEEVNNEVAASHYEPSDLTDINVYGSSSSEKYKMRQVAVKPLQNLFDDAKSAGCGLKAISAYRSYKTQVETYNSKFSQMSKESVNTCSAMPGRSEHQTGYSIDIASSRNGSLAKFEGSSEAIWVQKNCYKYGFIVRYPNGKQKVTGYIYEPWHIRYVGVKLATILYKKNITLEEYYKVKTDAVADKAREDEYYDKYILKKSDTVRQQNPSNNMYNNNYNNRNYNNRNYNNNNYNANNNLKQNNNKKVIPNGNNANTQRNVNGGITIDQHSKIIIDSGNKVSNDISKRIQDKVNQWNNGANNKQNNSNNNNNTNNDNKSRTGNGNNVNNNFNDRNKNNGNNGSVGQKNTSNSVSKTIDSVILDN